MRLIPSSLIGLALLALCGAGTAMGQSPVAGAAPAPAKKAHSRPVATIKSPGDGAQYVPGTPVALAGDATGTEAGAAGLTFQWDVAAVHSDHSRSPVTRLTGKTATFTPRDSAASYEISLVVIDPQQVRDTATVRIAPKASGAKTAEAPAEPLAGPERSYPLGSGDQVHVMIYAGGEKQEDFTAEVSPSGTLTSPLLGEMRVGGATASAVSERMRTILARDFFVDPQVLVNVTSFARKIFVSGEVKTPGAYSVQEGLTVMGACTLAGGFTDFAAPNRVKILRTEGGTTRTIEIDLAKVRKGKLADPVVVVGDRIDVPHRRY